MTERLDAPPAVVEETIDRRGFLNRTMLGALAIFGVAFGGASIAVLWPDVPKNSYGGKINAGKLKTILADLKKGGRPIYDPTGKFYIVGYDTSDRDNQYVRAGVATAGIMALSQKCSHLGCRTPYCATSKFFECPCHGAIFNLAGEVRGGPAPAGLWRFRIEIDTDENVIVDTSRRTAQPPSGTDTTGQRAGSHCLEDVAVTV